MDKKETDELDIAVNNSGLQDEINTSKENTVVSLDNKFKNEALENESLSKDINSLDDLLKIDESIRSRVGIFRINQLVETKNIELAKTLTNELMKLNDKFGIEASILCYNFNTDEVEKARCLARLNEQALEQGIIGPNEQLPPSYYDKTKVVEQG